MIKRNLTPLLIATVATRTHRRRLLASGSAIRRRDVETISPRNRALLRLLFDRGLRVGEVVHLDLADLDKHAAELWVLGKGRTTNNGWPYQSRRWQRCGTGSATVAPGQGRWSVSFSSFGAKDP